MALPLQPGDIIALAQLAITVVQYGWSRGYNASTQFNELAEEARILAGSLKFLVQVIETASVGLYRVSGGRHIRLRWDSFSLMQIIGDCDRTLNETMGLLHENEHFAAETGPMDNIVFNIMVRHEFEALRQRLYHHNRKILLALAPFEIDLLSRIREDLGHIMVELTDMRAEIRQILRHIVPDWQQVQEAQDSIRDGIQIPEHLALRFQEAASAGSTESSVGQFPLQELLDAFLMHFDSLQQGGETQETRYLSVMKCAWILNRISSLRELRDSGADSHWPSFVRRLEAELVRLLPETQDTELTLVADSTPEAFSIWPPKKTPRAVDEVDANEMFEAVRTLTTRHATDGSAMTLVLDRRKDPGSQGFRLRFASSQAELEPRYFDLRTAKIKPTYVVQTEDTFDIVIASSRVTTVHFFRMIEAFQLQHAITGCEVLGYTQFHVKATLTILRTFRSTQHIYEHVWAQFWARNAIKGEPLQLKSQDSVRRTSRWSSRVSNQTAPLFDQGSREFATSTSPAYVPEGFEEIFAPRQMFEEIQLAPTVDNQGPTRNPLHGIPPSHNSFSHGPPLSAQPLATPMRSTSWHRTSVSPTLGSNISTSSSDRTALSASHSASLRLRPPRPLLVLFCEASNGRPRTTVTIELDATTDINTRRCACGQLSNTASGKCPSISLEHSAGKNTLNVRRDESGDWNLASRGEPWQDVRRLTLEFLTADGQPSPSERERFSGGSCRCAGRGRRNLETKRQRRECVIAGHRGLLGEIKEVYNSQCEKFQREQRNRDHVVSPS